MQDKKKETSFFSIKKKNPEKYIDINPTLDNSIREAKEDTVVLTFGRFSPPTIGHEKLIDKVVSVARSLGATPEVYLSHTTDAKKNPLSYEDKLDFMKVAFGNIIKGSNARTIVDISKDLSKKYKKMVLVVGSDRVDSFKTLLNNYNGKEYNFDEIEVVSAGERDPDSDDITGMSASKMRQLAKDGNESSFRVGLPRKLQSRATEVYAAVQKGMKIMKEELSVEIEELDEAAPLTFAQRRKRAMTMRRYANKLRTARERARKRKASPEKLKVRAQRQALNMIRQRLMRQKKYADMTVPEKIELDKRLANVPKSVIMRIARKELPKVRQAEMERLASLNKEKEETFNINYVFEQFANEPNTDRKKKFRYLFTKEGKVNLDKRFKMFKPKIQINESLEDFEAELLDLIESTEDFIEGAAVDRVKDTIEMEREADKRKHKRMLSRAREIDKVRFEGLDKTDPKNREYGTDSLVKILKSDTPGEEDLDEARMVPPLKHAKTTVPDFVEPATPDIAALVSKHNKHHLGIGLSLKQMVQHAIKSRDTDDDGDIDAEDMKAVGDGELVGDPSFDRTKTPGEATRRMQQKYEKEKKHVNVGLAFEDYYAGLSKSTAAKRKAHFKKGAAMDDNNPAAYKPAPGDARAETKPSIYTKRFKAMYGEETELSESSYIVKLKSPFFKTHHYVNLDDPRAQLAKRHPKHATAMTIDKAEKVAKDWKGGPNKWESEVVMKEEAELFESAESSLRDKAEKTGISYGILKKVFDRGVAAWRTGHRPGTTPVQWGHARVNSFATGGKTRQTADADLWKQHSSKNESIDENGSVLKTESSDVINKIIKRERTHRNIAKALKSFSDVAKKIDKKDHGDAAEKIAKNYELSMKPKDLIKLYHRIENAKSYEKAYNNVDAWESFDVNIDKTGNDIELDLTGLNESELTDKILNAVRKHVLNGENLMDITWKISQLAAVDIPPKKIYDMYISKYGHDKKPSVDKTNANALRSKYGFAAEEKTRGFEGKMIDVPNVPVRMVNGKIKMLPPGKSSSSDGNGGE